MRSGNNDDDEVKNLRASMEYAAMLLRKLHTVSHAHRDIRKELVDRAIETLEDALYPRAAIDGGSDV